MALLTRVALALATLAAGCSQALDFNECNTDTDCAARAPDGGKLYCTGDHLCVVGLPNDRLCTEVIDPKMSGTPLVIGVLTDANLEIDKQIANAVKLAITQINQLQAGASQPPIVARFCDTASDPAQSLKAATKAIETYGATALIGPTTSGGVVAVTSYVKSKGVLVISPSATAIDLTSLQDDNLVWRTVPSDALQAKLLAQRVAAAAKASMAQPHVDEMHVDTVYGRGLSTAFATEYAQQNGLGFHKSFPYVNASDVPQIVNAIAADNPTPTHVVVIADTDDPSIARAIATQAGLSTQQFFFTDPAKTSDLYGTMGTADPAVLARIRGTAPAQPAGPAYDTFRSQFIGMFTTDPRAYDFLANAYDATYLVAIAAAATQGHVPTGKELATGLARVKVSGNAVQINQSGGYLMALMQMAQGGVRLTGASGPLEFDSSGDPTTGTFEFWCVNTNPMPHFSIVDAMNNCP